MVYRNLLSHSTAQKFAFILRTTEEKKKEKSSLCSTEICFHTLEYKNLLLHTVSSHTGAQNLFSHSKIPTCAFTNCAAELTPGPGIPGMLGGPPGPGFIMYIASPEPAESATKWSVPRQHCLHHQVRVTFNNKAISGGHLSHRAKQRLFFSISVAPSLKKQQTNKQNNKQFKHVLTSEAALTLKCFRRGSKPMGIISSFFCILCMKSVVNENKDLINEFPREAHP